MSDAIDFYRKAFVAEWIGRHFGVGRGGADCGAAGSGGIGFTASREGGICRCISQDVSKSRLDNFMVCFMPISLPKKVLCLLLLKVFQKVINQIVEFLLVLFAHAGELALFWDFDDHGESDGEVDGLRRWLG